MAASSIRRPIPAIVFILLLSLISALVWWRVLHRDPAQGAKSTTSATSTTSTTSTPSHCVLVTAAPVAWPAPATITVSVLNATNRPGLAGSVTKAMKQRGFQATKPDNDTESAITEVRSGPKYGSAARLVQLYLPGSRLVTTNAKTPTIVVSVGSGYKALSTSAQVTKAKAKAPAVRSCR